MKPLAILTVATFGLLVLLWSAILIFYIRRLVVQRLRIGVFTTLILVLAIDAFRTLFESAYFGMWYAAVSGILPSLMQGLLEHPGMVFIPKAFNVAAAIAVIALLLRRWLPQERRHLEQEKQSNEAMERRLAAQAGLLGQAQRQLYWEVAGRKIAEAERERLIAAIEQSGEIILITSSNGLIQYANHAFSDTTGYSPEEARGLNITDLASTHSAPNFRLLEDHLTHGNPWKGRLLCCRKDESIFEVAMTVSPMMEPSGTVVNFVVVTRDITRESQLEAQLRQSQKMQAIGALAGGIAHDFNNILSAIMGYTSLALESIPSDHKAYGDLQEVEKASARARELVQHILTFSRETEQEALPVEIALIVNECLGLLRATLPTTIEIVQNVHPSDATILADPAQMHQIVMNLCTNAYQAMRDIGGILEIAVEVVEVDQNSPRIVQDLNPGTYVRLRISDSGHGMDRETMARIFEPFFTTKKHEGGTGLGLATVHGIVKNAGGAITVYSESGQGTTFHVYFPQYLETTVPHAVSSTIAPIGNRECILLVDDEEVLVEVEKRMLETYGYTVEGYNSPVEALTAFRANPEKYALILTDQTMPHLTGVQLGQEARRTRSDIPIVIASGFSDGLSAEMRGPDTTVVMKPIAGRELAESVHRAIKAGGNRVVV
jgi:PAS domain S-box-containing protein